MTTWICDSCKKILREEADGRGIEILSLCGKCQKEELEQSSSPFSDSWEQLPVGEKDTREFRGKTYSCELMKAMESYVNIKVTATYDKRLFAYIVLVKSYVDGRVTFFRKDDSYSLGFIAQEYLVSILKREHQDQFSFQKQNCFWEAIEVVQGEDKQ